jgi:hypothetical protein
MICVQNTFHHITGHPNASGLYRISEMPRFRSWAIAPMVFATTLMAARVTFVVIQIQAAALRFGCMGYWGTR